mgnify:CR=1 FL=1
MHIWHLWHGLDSEGQDEYHAELCETPFWAQAVSWLAEEADTHSGHLLCGAGAPDWLWRVPVGLPRYDHAFCVEGKPWLENSVAAAMNRLYDRLACLDVMRRRVLHAVTVDSETAALLGWQHWDDFTESS